MLRTNGLALLAVLLLCCELASAQATPGAGSRPRFESAYTDLAKECKAAVKESEAAEGQDIPQRCKGYGGYFASIGYSAFFTFVGVEAEDGKTAIALSPGKGGELPGTKLEWRLADGKPFAVILRYSFYREDDIAAGESPFKDKNKIGESLVVKGLRGYEQTINFEVDAKTPNANEKARELADSAYLRGR